MSHTPFIGQSLSYTFSAYQQRGLYDEGHVSQ